MISDLEPLLPDDRVGKIADLLHIAFPELPQDVEIFTFVVPSQVIPDRRADPRIPHIKGCRGGDDCECGPFEIPEQAVFALKSDNPRAGWDAVYKGKQVMSASGLWRSVWEREEKSNKHFVSPREDPAWAPFAIAARSHVDKIKGYRDII